MKNVALHVYLNNTKLLQTQRCITNPNSRPYVVNGLSQFTVIKFDQCVYVHIVNLI